MTIGDFATATVDGTFRLAFIVFNTIMNLTEQGAQVACFRNPAGHLEAGGSFVVEVIVPPPSAPAAGRAVPCVRRDADSRRV